MACFSEVTDQQGSTLPSGYIACKAGQMSSYTIGNHSSYLDPRKETRCARVDTNWLVIDFEMSYNTITGRPSLTEVRATISPYQLLMKFLIDWGRAEVRGDQIAAKKCYVSSL